MKGTFRGILIGMALSLVIFGAAEAAGWYKTITVYNGPDIYVKGEKIDPTDINGNKVETFVYNGTTYVPLRAVSTALDKLVSYDKSTHRVNIEDWIPYDQAFVMYCINQDIDEMSSQLANDIHAVLNESISLKYGYSTALPYHSKYVDMYEDTINYHKDDLQRINDIIEDMSNYEYFKQFTDGINKDISILEKQLESYEKAVKYFKNASSSVSEAEKANILIDSETSTLYELRNKLKASLNEKNKIWVPTLSGNLLTFE